MPWSTLAANQTVTFNNLQDAVNNGIFTLKNGIPVSQECITKTDANFFVNINTSIGSYASKSAQQLVYKADLVSPSPSNTVTYVPSSGLYPVSGNVFASSTGVITNYFSTSVTLFAVFNSAGLSSGTISNDNMAIIPLSPSTISGMISSTGQLFFSINPYTLAANTAYNISIQKGDLLGGGSTVRFYYSTNPFGGPYIAI